MAVCCCSLAGTAACQHCASNPLRDFILDRILVATYAPTLQRENVTVFITRQLLCELIGEPYRPKDGMKPTLFGCDVEVIEKPGRWWAVGVKREEGE